MTNQRDDDDDLLVAYATGELDEAARMRCEQRLADEPAFARRLVAFEAIDVLASSLRRRDDAVVRGPVRPRRSWPWLAVAAAAVLLVAARLWWVPATSPELPCEVRAVASLGDVDVATYGERLGLPENLRYVGSPRGGTSPTPAVTASQFVAAVVAREQERARDAFALPPAPLTESFFTLRLEVAEPCHALVLQLDASGRWNVRFPSTVRVPPFAETTNPLVPGVHTLPRPVAVANAIGGVSLHAGFARGDAAAAGAERWLVAVRREALTPELVAELTAWATASAVPFAVEANDWANSREGALVAWLQARGFTCRPVALGS